jgi:K+-transporting ATPase ATPase A chain
MTINGMIQIGLYFIVLLALVKPLGSYMARVYQGETFWASRMLGPVEQLIYRMLGTRLRMRCPEKLCRGSHCL